MDTKQMVVIIREIAEKFNKLYGCIDLVMLLKDKYRSKNSNTYTLLFSSKSLDELPPYESILKVVTFFREYNSEIFDMISSIITIHSEDDDIYRIKEIMTEMNDDFIIEKNKGLELFGTKIDNGIILKTS